tara:strand:- start:9444 stop:9608 length:165 start_codon:yes stop_codon:yes gene_type:complete
MQINQIFWIALYAVSFFQLGKSVWLFIQHDLDLVAISLYLNRDTGSYNTIDYLE